MPERILAAVTPAHTAHRAVPRPVDDRGRAPRPRAPRRDRPADPRRRSAVGRRDRGRREGARLLHRLGAEMAVRPGGHGALVVADPDALRVGHPSYLSQDGLRAGRCVPAPRGSGAIRPEPHPGLAHGRPAGRISRPFRRGRTSAPPRWRSASARVWPTPGETSSCPRSARRSSPGARRSRSRPTSSNGLAEAGVIVRDLPGRGLVRASVGWWTSDDDLERLAGRAVRSGHVLRPRLRAADPGALGRGGVARRPRPRSRRRQPVRRVRRDARRAAGVGVVILPDVRGLYRFYEELALRFAERGYAAVAFDYFGRTAGAEKRDDDFEYMPHVRQTTRDGRAGRRRGLRRAPPRRGRASRSSRSGSASAAATPGSQRHRATALPERSASTDGPGQAADGTPGPIAARVRDGVLRSWPCRRGDDRDIPVEDNAGVRRGADGSRRRARGRRRTRALRTASSTASTRSSPRTPRTPGTASSRSSSATPRQRRRPF